MVRRFNESDTLDWVGKEYKQGIERYNADTTFKRGGITYFIEFLDPYGSNYLAKWWDNSDNGLGYNNQGFVAVNNPFNRMTGYFSPENIDDYLVLFSDYDRKPPMSIQRVIFDKVKRQLDYDSLNDVRRTNESIRIGTKIGKSFNGKRFTEGKRIISQDEYDYWFNIGLEAFERGDMCVPAHNKELMDYIKEHPSIRNTEINDENQFKKTEKITKAWTDGWIYGNNKKYDAGKFFESTDNTLRRLGEGNSSLKLKKVKTGKYTTTDEKYEIEKSDGFWYAVDTKTGQSVVDCENSLSAIKDSLESYIKSDGKKESFRRLREGDASKKTNYAVIVRDMNKGTYNLYTGTKADCEQLLSDLDAFESFANECDDEDEYFAEEEYIIDLLSSYGCLSEIYRNMIDKNDNYNVGLHYGDYLGGMIHIINADNPIDLYI